MLDAAASSCIDHVTVNKPGVKHRVVVDWKFCEAVKRRKQAALNQVDWVGQWEELVGRKRVGHQSITIRTFCVLRSTSICSLARSDDEQTGVNCLSSQRTTTWPKRAVVVLTCGITRLPEIGSRVSMATRRA